MSQRPRDAAPGGDPRPIGVFDSGVGGLTVVAALKDLLPAEPVLYLGDTARLPYGTKSPVTVLSYSRRNVEFLVGRGVKGVVVACNTASAVAIDALDPPVPLWGVLRPGAEEAVRRSRGRIGVIATESTIGSDAYGQEIRRLDSRAAVLGQACSLFVPLVEDGWEDDPVTLEIARRYLAPLQRERIDTLVLGCTHYPLLARVLRQVLGEEIHLVDSARAVAKVVARDLAAAGLLAPSTGRRPEDRFCVTDTGERFQRIAARFLGRDSISLELVEVV
jgi:glutamate racemase